MAFRKRRLALRTRTGYGAVEFGMSAAEVMLIFYLLEFYTKVVGLRAELAGFALSLAVLWDAIADPIMGGISIERSRASASAAPIFFLDRCCLRAVSWRSSRPRTSTARQGSSSSSLARTCLPTRA